MVIDVLIMSPDPWARVGLQKLLEDQESCRVVGAIAGEEEWEEALALYQPEILVCDLGWQNELELSDLRTLELPVVALVADEEGAAHAWTAGAKGILQRVVSAEILSTAITATHQNLLILDPQYTPTSPTTLTPDATLIDPLTPREQEVLALLANGLTNRAIAHQLHISDHTVKFHVNALLSKLGAQSRTAAAVTATRLGLLSL